ncbi:pilus assembly protein TadG-related protein [Cryptosporangium phraense]|uniref:pilus assembly protein TadG-related protein n=1 Tax=Cryptosporangium phraense TaxID=2593070 RepID=UPI00197B0383|nr:pilus assembly protein TadG-related protein [Cryptosporangium phraense]
MLPRHPCTGQRVASQRWAGHRLPTGESGQATAFLAVLVVALLLLAGLVLDGGTALAARTRALDAAQSAARAGAQQLDLPLYRATGQVRLDPYRAERAAQNFLAAAGIPGQVTTTTGAVTVTTRTDRPTQLLQLVGVDSLHATGTATAIPTTPGEQP